MRCLYLGCYWECWWCLCSIEDADVTCKLFISFSQSKHLLKNPLFHSNLGPFPAQRPLVHLPYCDFFAEVPEPTLPCLRNEAWLFFIYGLCMKNPSLCSMLNTQYTLFNMTILCFLNFESKDTQFLCKPAYHLLFTRTLSVSLPLVAGFWAQLASSDRLLSTQLGVRIMCTPVLECISVFLYQKRWGFPCC